jgi:8-oxo-dGTP pyrophosphatase MutT (NUDIX family)
MAEANNCRKGKRVRHSADTSKKAAEAQEIVDKVSTGNKIDGILTLPPGTIRIGDTLFNPARGTHAFKHVLAEFEQIHNRQAMFLDRYVVVFAHAHLYKDSPRHVLVVRKAANTLHAGLLNLPGGRVEEKERPERAALRELKEECGVEGNQPQLVGAILPSGSDAIGNAFVVYVYRCIINPGQEISYPPEQPASWQLIEDCRNGKWVPGLSVILPLLAANVIGFICQDAWWEANQTDLPDGYVPTNSQSVVTFLRHKVSDAANQEKQRFTT